jgi:membrane-associated phospholipid phosphatase
LDDQLLTAWRWITRLGEAGIVLPVAVALAIWFVASARSLRPASAWALSFGASGLITTISKVAFLGWGIGIAAIDFTGFSGHAMFAAAVYPVFARAVAETVKPGARAAVIAAGYAFSAVIAASRVPVGAHSLSETVSGFALGAAASGAALWFIGRPRLHLSVGWLALAIAAWLSVAPSHASPSRTHSMVTRLALVLSQRSEPFRREDLHRRVRMDLARNTDALGTPSRPGAETLER